MTTEPVFKIFAEAAEYVSDTFWKETLMSCAYNRFPKGARFDPKTSTISIRVQIGNKPSSDTTIISTNPEQACSEVIELFKEKLTVYSPFDLKIKEAEVEKLQNEYMESINCEWKKLKPRSVKDTMIEMYVAELGNKYSFTQKESKYVMSTLLLAFQFKALIPDDVVYEDCKIQTIKGFAFDPEKRECVLSRTVSYSTKKEKKQQSQKFDQLLTNYTKSVKNRNIK